MTSLAGERTGFRLRPRYDSANIRTWIGFKQFMALAEEAVLEWFRASGHGPRSLYHEYGLGLSVVDSSVLLPSVLEIDDEVIAEVTPAGVGRFTVTLSAAGVEEPIRALRGRLRVALVTESGAPARYPADLAELVVPRVDQLANERPAGPPAEAFGWDWRVRYFHCHYSDRVQHSAYIRALEEVVDRFLAKRGLSVPRLLADRGWIPVVSRARVRLLADAHMDELVRATFTVDEVIKDRVFDGRMECWVLADAAPRCVATANILHGYAVSRGAQAGQLAELDAGTVSALLNGAAR